MRVAAALARSLCSACLLLLLASWTDALTDASEQHDSTLTTSPPNKKLLLARILDAEQIVLERQIEAYKRKADVLKALLARYEVDDGEQDEARRGSNSSQTPAQARRAALLKQNRERADRQQHQHASDQRFSDWFDRQSPYRVDPQAASRDPNDGRDNNGGADRYRVDLFSFRPIAMIGGRKNPHTYQTNSLMDSPSSTALHQFLVLFDTKTGQIDLLHPTTRELVWQHSLFSATEPLSSASLIADYFFVSERKSYLAILRESGEVSLFKLRVLHNRRLLSGDHRPLSRFDRAECARTTEEVDATSRSASGELVPPPWRSSTRKTTPAANHLHVDFELMFRADASIRRDRMNRGKVAIVSLYSQAYVVVANSSGELMFFHAENGAFIKAVQTGEPAGGITHFKALASGVLAFVSGSRIRFVNAADQAVVQGATCEAGTMDIITSIDSDPWHHSMLYAGTNRGRGLVFRLLNFDRARRSSGARHSARRGVSESEWRLDSEQPACVLIGQMLPQPSLIQPELPASTFVRAIPGYLVMATRDQVVLFQTNGGGIKVPSHVTEYPRISAAVALVDSTAQIAERIVGLSVSRDLLVHPVALALHVLEHYRSMDSSAFGEPLYYSRLRVDVYESLVPQPTSSLDLGWLRAPVMLLCAVAVMYWQQQRGANFGTGHNRADDFDVAAFARMAAARGGAADH